jgi:hypothetical protein
MTRYQISLLVRNKRTGQDAVHTSIIDAPDATDACRAFAGDATDAHRALASHIYKSLLPQERVVSVVHIELLCVHEGSPCPPTCRCECPGCTAPEWEKS